MSEMFNIYCDEACHLEHDRSPVMVLGAVWCKLDQVRSISKRIREYKRQHKYIKDPTSPDPDEREVEIKWTNVSRPRLDFYRELIDYFFDDDDLSFRGVIIDKTDLDHERFGQTHDDWYYKMLFKLLEPIIDPRQHYRIYLDIKDTKSEEKRKKLEDVLRHSRDDEAGRIVTCVQQIRSNESEIMQIADLLLGAIAYHNRRAVNALPTPDKPSAKMEIVGRIRERWHKSLSKTTWMREPKLSLFRWEPKTSDP